MVRVRGFHRKPSGYYGVVQIFDLANNTYAKLLQERSDWIAATAGGVIRSLCSLNAKEKPAMVSLSHYLFLSHHAAKDENLRRF